MCGINGITKNDPKIIRKANNLINHRGPDFTDIFSNSRVAIGHALLSIRSENISESAQPLFSDDCPWVLAFNGQIYNTADLKSDHLRGTKYCDSDLDTIILYGIIRKYGWRFIEYIEGMFAISLYNRDENILRIYRDPSGQKNIYYSQSEVLSLSAQATFVGNNIRA